MRAQSFVHKRNGGLPCPSRAAFLAAEWAMPTPRKMTRREARAWLNRQIEVAVAELAAKMAMPDKPSASQILKAREMFYEEMRKLADDGFPMD